MVTSSLATSGGGVNFENHVQASFVTLMLTGGYIPLLPNRKIREIQLQTGQAGYKTDDVLVVTESNNQESKFIGNIKLSVQFTKSDNQLASVIRSAWLDFNNENVFNKNQDKLALITGPLNAIDTKSILWILEQAKCIGQDDFFERIDEANFSPPRSVEKLLVIRHHLTKANNDKAVSKERAYEFLKHWQILIYDLERESSVVLSLLYSHISQISMQDARSVWSRTVTLVGSYNKYAGIITQESLPQHLKDLFDKTTHTIPEHLQIASQNTLIHDFYGYGSNFAIASLIGSWNQHNENDVAILKDMFQSKYEQWVQNAKEVLTKAGKNTIITLKNSVWKINQTTELYNTLSGYFFDDNLNDFKQIALKVLKEEQGLIYSKNLRTGIAQSLVILGNIENLPNCSADKQTYITTNLIYEIFSNANWQLWASLDDVMPILAEASPDQFLKQIEQDLSSDKPQIPKLFEQESDDNSFFGQSYLTGLLWGLEALAWDEKLLIKVCVILAKLASIDPEGKWGNRSINSIETILLPWLPRTTADTNKRKAAVDAICDEYPNIAWDILIKFLPDNVMTSSSSYRPKWRNPIPDDWNKEVTHKEYWEQIDCYVEKLISLTGNEVEKLTALIDNLSNLKQSPDNLLKILKTLSSGDVLNLSEDNRSVLWRGLIKLISRHTSRPDAKWALDNELLKQIENVSDTLKPSDPSEFYQHLFSLSYGYSAYREKNESFEQIEERVAQERKNAVKEILSEQGIDSVIEFANIVKSPSDVGHSLALIRTNEIDKLLLPNFLNENNNKLSEFISGYVWTSFYEGKWEWVESLAPKNWTTKQQSQFLISLPFKQETWDKVEEWLGNQESLYWLHVRYLYSINKSNYVIKKLLQYNRPKAAIHFLGMMNYKKEDIDTLLCVRALIDAKSSQEPEDELHNHHIAELIEILQKSEETSQSDMMTIEWSYLSLLDGHSEGTPITLENQLANNPEFFCEIIQARHRSKNTLKNKQELTKNDEIITNNVFQLLYHWKTVPGVEVDNKTKSFNDDKFNNWLSKVTEICTKSGHLGVAFSHIGKVLIHSPEDPSGLWIHKTIAKVLNHENASRMREGYESGLFNSRGGYWADPTGKPEFDLANKYSEQANEVENAGFHRLATTLRELSDDYKKEANRRINK